MVTPPAEEPVDLATCKLHMRVTIDDDDALIAGYIVAARQWVERVQGRALVTQTWDYTRDTFPWDSLWFELPRPPLQSVTSLTYTDSTNTPNVWPSSNYIVDAVSEPGRLVLNYGVGWPAATLRTVNAVVVRFVAGYGLGAAVPWTIKQAILLLVEHWYEFREPVMAQRGVVPAEVEFTVNALLRTTEIAGVS